MANLVLGVRALHHLVVSKHLFLGDFQHGLGHRDQMGHDELEEAKKRQQKRKCQSYSIRGHSATSNCQIEMCLSESPKQRNQRTNQHVSPSGGDRREHYSDQRLTMGCCLQPASTISIVACMVVCLSTAVCTSCSFFSMASFTVLYSGAISGGGLCRGNTWNILEGRTRRLRLISTCSEAQHCTNTFWMTAMLVRMKAWG